MLEIAELLNDLNPEQRAAVLHQEGPAIVLAGAGSGKTRVLTTRVAYLLASKKIPSSHILLVTFTNKAANEMKNRVFQFSQQELFFSGTFHSLASKILRIEGREGQLAAFGLNENFSIYDSDEQISLLKSIYKKLGADQKQYKVAVVKSVISQAKQELISPEEYQEIARDGLQHFTSKIYKNYQFALKEQNAVDFDDLLNLLYRLLKENKKVREKYQKNFEYVLVDEYQDTNKVQYFLSKLLAAPQNNLFVVGDFSQSIYAWRGADYRNLQRLSRDFPEMKEYRLEHNYRSTQTILDAATQVISQNKSHPVLALWTDQVTDEKLEVYETSNGELEAYKVAEIIKTQYADRLQDIAILYRTNAQSRSFEEAFLKRGIPYRLVGGTKFYERKEIKDLLAYLQLAFNPLHEPALERAQKNGKTRLAAFFQWRKQVDQETLNQAALCLQAILEVTQYLQKFDRKDPEDQQRLENIQELLNVAAQSSSTVSFLENVALVQDGYLLEEKSRREPEIEEKRVTLMSLHSAKGLEFAIVFMVGMEEGLLPHNRSLFDDAELEEERRLCYVGITRAKEKLYFSYARQRMTYGFSNQALPSRFLSEIDRQLLQTKREFDLESLAYPQNSYRSFAKKKTSSSKGTHNEPRLIVDEDAIDALLNDEIDISTFLRKR
jgi:DNA helicase-2/ATP-dependent DNA helicase PcrA